MRLNEVFGKTARQFPDRCTVKGRGDQFHSVEIQFHGVPFIQEILNEEVDLFAVTRCATAGTDDLGQGKSLTEVNRVRESYCRPTARRTAQLILGNDSIKNRPQLTHRHS